MDIKTYLKNSIYSWVDRDLLLQHFTSEDVQFAYSKGWISADQNRSEGDYVVYEISVPDRVNGVTGDMGW